MIRRKIVESPEVSDGTILDLSQKSQIQLGTLVPDNMRSEVMRTLYTWRDLGIEDVKDFALAPSHGTGLNVSIGQRDEEGVEARLHESTVAANGGLSDWSAEPKVVPITQMNV